MAAVALALSITIIISTLRQRTDKTFQKWVLILSISLLTSAIISNILISIYFRQVSPEGFILMSKKVQGTFDILFGITIGAFVVAVSSPEISSGKDFLRYMKQDFPNSYVLYIFVLVAGLLAVISTEAEVTFTDGQGFIIVIPAWSMYAILLSGLIVILFVPYKLLGYLKRTKPGRNVAIQSYLIILGLEGYTISEMFFEIAFPNLGMDLRSYGFVIEMALVGMVAFAIRQKSFIEELIVAVPEADLKTERRYEFERGFSYAILEQSPVHSFTVFKDMVTHGVQGLCITRNNPINVAAQYGLEKTPIFWLSRVSNQKNCIRPTPVENISMAVDRFLETSNVGAILLDGVEYLIAHNEFRSVLSLLHDLNEKISAAGSILIMPIDPETLNPKELALIRRDVRTLAPAELKRYTAQKGMKAELLTS